MTSDNRFLQEISDTILIGDGAIGTALFARGATPEMGVERMNVLAPDVVQQLHRDYMEAGSRVIETNTFGASLPNLARYGVESENEVREIILAGTRLARQAARDDTYVAGSVGPLPTLDGEPFSSTDQTRLFAAQVSALLEGGVDLLIFESFASLDELVRAVAVAQSMTDLPIIAQSAFSSEGFTADGAGPEDVATQCKEAGADVVGANCGYGVTSVLAAIRRMAGHGIPMSAYMNAGFPERVEERLIYVATTDYLVRRALDLADLGVHVIGGCCGTDPDTIRSISRAMSDYRPSALSVQPSRPVAHVRILPPEQPAHEEAPKFPILVELDPPRGLDLEPLVEAAKALKVAGATSVTIADNPLASVRVDNFAVAGIIQRETGIPVVPHLTGRDRNRLSIQSTIMGAHVLGIRSILCITGDPIRMCQDPNTSGVFDLTSVGLVRMVSDFNEGHRGGGDCRTEFSVGVALNPNVRTISGQIDKFRRKIDAGAHFALTQPIFEEERLDILQQALADADISTPVYIGILPLVSARNAEFLHNEVPGIWVPDEIRARMSGYESLADQRAAGIEIAAQLVERFAPRIDGIYLICPRNRFESVIPLILSTPRPLPLA